jgi:CheY-like chemotaxis protein/DNA-directed RNA polymerase specialized sigma24 family protein
MSETIELDELKNLRRYAFCIFGNRLLSDMAVEAAIETLASREAAAGASRFEVYRKVNAAARSSSYFDKVGATVAGGMDGRFLRLPAAERQICALHTVIGFSHADIASIMGLPESKVRHIYIKSLDALRQNPAAVLIIEDEALIAWELHEIVANLGLFVVGTARNRAEALRIAGAARPRLILADYSLNGDSGVDVVKAIREQMDTDVIYVTAHPEVVTANRETTRDIVIPKPFNARAVERAVQFHLAA